MTSAHRQDVPLWRGLTLSSTWWNEKRKIIFVFNDCNNIYFTRTSHWDEQKNKTKQRAAEITTYTRGQTKTHNETQLIKHRKNHHRPSSPSHDVFIKEIKVDQSHMKTELLNNFWRIEQPDWKLFCCSLNPIKMFSDHLINVSGTGSVLKPGSHFTRYQVKTAPTVNKTHTHTTQTQYKHTQQCCVFLVWMNEIFTCLIHVLLKHDIFIPIKQI